MTTKQRVQVQGLGEAPSIKPVDLPGFQFGIPQRQAGTNKLLDLASGFQQLGKITNQYAGIRQQELTRDIELEKAQAAQFQEEQREQEKFDQVLLKKHINTKTLLNLQTKTQDLLNVEKYSSTDQMLQTFDAFEREEWEALNDALGEGVANSLASKSLWNAVIPQYRQKILGDYLKNKEQFQASEKINEITTSFNAVFSGDAVISGKRLESLIQNFDQQIADELPNYTKPQRSALLLEAVDQQAKRLRADRRFSDAARLLDGVELVKVNGAPIFQSTAAFSKLTEIRRSINESLFNIASKDTETMDAEFKGAGRLAFLTMSGKNSVADLDEADYQNLRDALRYLAPDPQSTPDAELDRIINEELFGQEGANPSRALLFAMNNLARKNPDDGLRMLQRTTPSILTTLKNTEGILPASARVDLREVREGLEAEFRTAFAQHDPLKGDFTDADFLKDKPEFKGYAGLRKLSEELNAGSVIRNYTSYTGLDKTLENALIPAAETIEKDKKTYKDILGNAFLSSYKDQSKQIIQLKALDYARDLFLENPDDPEFKTKVDTFIQTEVQKDVDLFKELAEATANKLGAFRQPSMADFRAIVKKEKEEAESWFPDPIEYKSLVTEELDLGLVYADQDKAFAVKEDPSRRHKDVLKGLLVQHGIPSYDKKYAKYLSKAGVDFRSVRLVRSTGELDSILRRWAPVIAKIHGEMELLKQGAPTDLNANEEDTWKEMRDFKVFDIQTLNDFKTSQQQLLNELRR